MVDNTCEKKYGVAEGPYKTQTGGYSLDDGVFIGRTCKTVSVFNPLLSHWSRYFDVS